MICVLLLLILMMMIPGVRQIVGALFWLLVLIVLFNHGGT
jgi:hypothetical protein